MKPEPENQAATWRCPRCGQSRHRRYPRLDRPALLASPLALGALAYGLWSASMEWLGAAVLALLLFLLGRVAGGVRWWGGRRCTGCGHVEMLR